MPLWSLVVLLLVGTHFGASYLVPLHTQDQRLFWGLLRWVWPWGVGDRGFLGQIDGVQMPMLGFALAMAAATALLLAALGVLGWWVPQGWWRPLAAVGAASLLLVSVGFLGATKLLPLGLGILLLLVALDRVPAAR